MSKDLFLHPFALGLYLGLIFAAIVVYRYFRLKGELKRYKRHLSDKLEIEADSLKKIKDQQESLRQENENMRVKIASLNDLPERKLQRDFEILARAEKRMIVSVPGFAPAWESAKSAAVAEIEAEEAGRSIPKRIAGMLFGSGRKDEGTKALTDVENSVE